MAQQIITPEKAAEIDQLLSRADEVRSNLVKGKLAGLVTDAQIDEHDQTVLKLKRIKQQFLG